MGDHAPDDAAKAGAGADLDLEEGRLLFAGASRFMLAVAGLDQLPPPGVPEIAVAGRSNVGKSSLVNALSGHRALARASGQPGRTQQLILFDIAERLILVDMPGYGYAEAPKTLKAGWQGLMFEYLRGRPSLRRALLLLDARIEVKASDLAAMDLLDRAAVTYQLVLTKADALRPQALAAKRAVIERLARARPAAYPEVLTTSSRTGLGIPELRAAIAFAIR